MNEIEIQTLIEDINAETPNDNSNESTDMSDMSNAINQEQQPNSFGISISHTTRKPHGNEQNTIDYNFIDKKQFDIDISNNKFYEYVSYNNEYYGTSINSINNIQKNGNKICIIEINVFGAETLQKNNNIECNYLYITTSSGIKTLRKENV